MTRLMLISAMVVILSGCWATVRLGYYHDTADDVTRAGIEVDARGSISKSEIEVLKGLRCAPGNVTTGPTIPDLPEEGQTDEEWLNDQTKGGG
jgi:hypothetical protein